ncbi:Gfo/Idh/MocA family oxidoreductase [Klenkia terrae]|uniref:Gfo/Idh/MocA family oxidoreductase n=1 Tax=Klenkia terrae TaxID=1052259 RepID=A0ABU8E9M5_9ACTN|nr:Gfo/Idh/MocA family oxidoreductase [Klenkia terrae]SSC25561.1 Oxidoreductase [Klenkia terrae]
MDDGAVRFGLVGYGFGGRYFHAPLLAAAQGVDFLGVVTTSPERRALVAQEHPSAACFDSLEALVEAGAEAVAISTPADTHSPLTDRALDLGLAVVCDKPFALDAAAAQASVDRAAAAGLALAPYQNRRWDSDFLTLRRLVDEGALGEVRTLESRFERMSDGDGPGAAGGGTLRDFGSHLVDQALVLLGPVGSVFARWSLRESGLDDDVLVVLDHVSGARSVLGGSWRTGAPGPRFRVVGTAGSYVVGDQVLENGMGAMDGQEFALIAGTSPATADWGTEPETAWGRLQRGAESTVVPSERGRWDTFYPAFAAAVRGTGPVPVDPRDAVATARVLDAARRSATEGVVVSL